MYLLRNGKPENVNFKYIGTGVIIEVTD